MISRKLHISILLIAATILVLYTLTIALNAGTQQSNLIGRWAKTNDPTSELEVSKSQGSPYVVRLFVNGNMTIKTPAILKDNMLTTQSGLAGATIYREQKSGFIIFSIAGSTSHYIRVGPARDDAPIGKSYLQWQSKRASSLNNLKWLSNAISMYMQENDEEIPKFTDTNNMKEILLPYLKSPGIFVDPKSGKPYLPNPNLKAKANDKSIQKSNLIMICEATPDIYGGRCVCYLDGRSSWLSSYGWSITSRKSGLDPTLIAKLSKLTKSNERIVIKTDKQKEEAIKLRAPSLANLKQIATSMQMYLIENDYQMPPLKNYYSHTTSTVNSYKLKNTDDDIDLEWLLPYLKNPKCLIADPITKRKFCWNCALSLLSSSKFQSHTKEESDIAVVFDPVPDKFGGVIVGFIDGHVRWLNSSEWKHVQQKSGLESKSIEHLDAVAKNGNYTNSSNTSNHSSGSTEDRINNPSRYEIIDCMVKTLDIPPATSLKTSLFPDMPSESPPSLLAMEERNLIPGLQDGTFGGEKLMPRYEWAIILKRYADNFPSAIYNSFIDTPGGQVDYTDVPQGANYLSVHAMRNIIPPCSDGLFHGEQYISKKDVYTSLKFFVQIKSLIAWPKIDVK